MKRTDIRGMGIGLAITIPFLALTLGALMMMAGGVFQPPPAQGQAAKGVLPLLFEPAFKGAGIDRTAIVGGHCYEAYFTNDGGERVTPLANALPEGAAFMHIDCKEITSTGSENERDLTIPVGAIAGSPSAGSVGTSELADGAVTTEKLHNGAVIGSKVQDESLTGSKLTAGTVAGNRLESHTIGGRELAVGAVDTANLSDAVQAKLNRVSQGAPTTELVRLASLSIEHGTGVRTFGVVPANGGHWFIDETDSNTVIDAPTSVDDRVRLVGTENSDPANRRRVAFELIQPYTVNTDVLSYHIRFTVFWSGGGWELRGVYEIPYWGLNALGDGYKLTIDETDATNQNFGHTWTAKSHTTESIEAGGGQNLHYNGNGVWHFTNGSHAGTYQNLVTRFTAPDISPTNTGISHYRMEIYARRFVSAE